MGARLAAAFAAGVLGAAWAFAAAAEPARSAGDIVNFFASQGQSASKLGASRGLCIGTQSECGVPAPAKPAAGLNLLVNFDLNSDRLTPEAKQNLDEFVKALKDPRLSGLSFTVDGYTDATGTKDYNQRLSERRAEAVVRYLDENGIAPKRLSAKGYGQEKPIGAGPFDPVNRRVEMRRLSP
ncbi:MAG TPA: OmpA family protein [Hyphomicrobiales bacterium]|nr:OmpA family protein [Hyphomicrobiales bacterium]